MQINQSKAKLRTISSNWILHSRGQYSSTLTNLGPGARQPGTPSIPESTHWFKLSDSKPLSCYPASPTLLVQCSVTQSCLTLWDPMDCSPPGSSVHGILQAGILEWVAISSSRGSSQPRDQIHVSCISCIGRQLLYHWATWEVSTHPSLENQNRGFCPCFSLAASPPNWPWYFPKWPCTGWLPLFSWELSQTIFSAAIIFWSIGTIPE